jgi:hypothetical protein
MASNLLARSFDEAFVISVVSENLMVVIAMQVIEMLLQALAAEESYRSVVPSLSVYSVDLLQMSFQIGRFREPPSALEALHLLPRLHSISKTKLEIELA